MNNDDYILVENDEFEQLMSYLDTQIEKKMILGNLIDVNDILKNSKFKNYDIDKINKIINDKYNFVVLEKEKKDLFNQYDQEILIYHNKYF